MRVVKFILPSYLSQKVAVYDGRSRKPHDGNSIIDPEAAL